MFALPLRKKNYQFSPWLKTIVEILLVILGSFLIHKYWLYPNIFNNFGTHTATGGSSFQNVLVYFQNLLDWSNGELYSPDINQYTWYGSTIGANEFSYFPSVIFGAFYKLTGNFTTSFNGLIFFNLYVLQVGMYYLIKHYTGNKWLSFSLVQLIPVTHGYKILYSQHLHAFLYFGLPFIILSLEKLLRSLSSKKQVFGWYIVYAVSLASILFSTWHVIVFAGLLLVSWAMFQIPHIIKNLKVLWRTLIAILCITLTQIGLLIPVALRSIEASVTLNSIRDINAVIAGGFNTISYGFVRIIAVPAAKLYIRINGPQEGRYIESIAQTSIKPFNYPDFLSNVGFYIVSAVIIYALIKAIKNKSLKHRTFLTYGLVFVFLYIVSIGPFFKSPQKVYYSVPFPYLLVNKLYYPLNAIRTIWRLPLTGFFSFLVAFGILANYAYNGLAAKAKSYKVSAFRLVNIVSAGLLIYLPIFVNAGWQDPIRETLPYDTELASILDSIDKDQIEIFEWYTDTEFYIDQREFAIFTSKYNYDRGEDKLRWVLGGGLGTYAQEMYTLAGMQKEPQYFNTFVDILHAKEVDVVVATKLDNIKEPAYDALQKKYSLLEEFDNKTVWSRQESADKYDFRRDLEYSLEGSSSVEQGSKFNIYFNQGNEAQEIYLTREKIEVEEVEIEILDQGEQVYTDTLKYSKPLVLITDTGRSTEFDIDLPNSIAPGEYTITATQGTEVLATKEIEVLDKDSYNELIKPSELEYSSEFKTTSVRRDIWSDLPLNINLKIDNGSVELQRTKLSSAPITQLKAEFFTEDKRLYTGFPAWLNQPSCPVNINLVKDDELSIWCNQSLPYDYDFYNFSANLVIE